MKQKIDIGVGNPLLVKFVGASGEEKIVERREFSGASGANYTLKKTIKKAQKSRKKKDVRVKKMALQSASQNMPTTQDGNGKEASESGSEIGNQQEVRTIDRQEEQRQQTGGGNIGQDALSTTLDISENEESRNMNMVENGGMSRRAPRKRSRVGERDGNDGRIQTGYNQVEKFGIGKAMKELQEIIRRMGQAGIKCGLSSKEIDDVFNNAIVHIVEMTTAMLNLQEEKAALMDQVLTLQQQAAKSVIGNNNVNPSSTMNYLQTAQKGLAKAVAAGTCLPPPVLPDTTKHVPAEKIILYKSETKGELPTKVQQEDFRSSIKNIIGNSDMSEISAIRATRLGGYTIIFRSEESRNSAMEKIEKFQGQSTEGATKQMIIAPKKKVAKIVCREPPRGYAHSQILQDFYGKHNPLLSQINRLDRQAKIFETRLGWVFELTSSEAAAVEGQGYRIRYGSGHEMRVEEFIPLCYLNEKRKGLNPLLLHRKNHRKE